MIACLSCGVTYNPKTCWDDCPHMVKDQFNVTYRELDKIRTLRDDFYKNTKHIGAGDIDRSYAFYVDRLLDGLNKILDKELL
jgi:hypothetical protein